MYIKYYKYIYYFHLPWSRSLIYTDEKKDFRNIWKKTVICFNLPLPLLPPIPNLIPLLDNGGRVGSARYPPPPSYALVACINFWENSITYGSDLFLGPELTGYLVKSEKKRNGNPAHPALESTCLHIVRMYIGYRLLQINGYYYVQKSIKFENMKLLIVTTKR